MAIACSNNTFFGLPSWYKYVCGRDFLIPEDIPLVLLALVEILLRVAGLVAIGFVVFGAVKYVVSQGEPDKTADAKGTIINALAGMVIATLSVAIVTFMGNRLGGSKVGSTTGQLDTRNLPNNVANEATIQTALSMVFVVTGAIAVMMVIIGAIKYAGSQGDPSQISKAKNTILYALVGLALSIFAVTIVSFVAGRVT